MNMNEQMLALFQQLTNAMQGMKLEIKALQCQSQNAIYELYDPRNSVNLFYPRIESQEVLLEKLINERKSLARFGDGEFALMDLIPRQKFQEPNPLLAKKLIETIKSNDERLLIGIADNYGDLSPYTEQAKLEIRSYMTYATRENHAKYLSKEKTYYDAYISRPYIMYQDKENAGNRFANLKKLWNDRNIIIIEGYYSRLGVGNDLFSNATSIKRILGPATNAFDKYEEILAYASSIANTDDLILLALGASATVMAYDLTKLGFQAIDIGHIDIEYEWYLQGATTRTSVMNKANNEFIGETVFDDNALPESYRNEVANVIT